MAAIAMLLGLMLFLPVLVLAALMLGVDGDRISLPELVGFVLIGAFVCGLVATGLVLIYA